jgi:hypothetical protein
MAARCGAIKYYTGDLHMMTNETTPSSETLIVVQSFRKANPDKRDRKLSAAKYLQKNGLRIRGVGPLLEIAGLAEQDNQSAIGWRPTQLMISLIADLPGQ